MKDISEYEDIIDLPHPISKNHKVFTPEERAVQFAPFAALKGHEEMLEAAAADNERRINEDEYL